MQQVSIPENIALDIRVSLFKEDRCFDFITVLEGKKHKKQDEALYLLTDNETKYPCYGGAAGGAKSWTGASWLTFMCLAYPNTRWFVGRKELKQLRESTLITFIKVFSAYGLKKDVDYKYNGQDHFITLLKTGSRIDFKDLMYKPSDPMYEGLGSIEYTGGWIEEAGEVDFKAFDTLKSRVGRHLNDEYGLLGKIFVTCNPKKNWLYSTFYKPAKEGTLQDGYAYIPCLVQDNPHGESGYVEALKSLKDKAKKERLLYGNWEYDDDPTALCDYDRIMDCFTNDYVTGNGQRGISADLAMQGRDRFVAGSWDGYVCTIKIDEEKSTGASIEADLKNLMRESRVLRSRVVSDSDGMGSYLSSYLKGIKEFHGNASAVDKQFANKKSECGFKLAEIINKGELKIICTEDQKERISEELGVLKVDSLDKDEGKKRLIKKEKMKELLGRSPDYLDMFLMYMVFSVQKSFTAFATQKR